MQRAGEFPQSDQQYFDLLARAVFSAGLGPKVVEARWDGLRAAFHGFAPAKVAAMGEPEVARLLSDPGVIRNRRKIEAVIANAVPFLETVKAHGSFHAFLEASGSREDLTVLADSLSERFAHLGRTSAALFLFSSGWRVRHAPLPMEAALTASTGDAAVATEAPMAANGVSAAAPTRAADAPDGAGVPAPDPAPKPTTGRSRKAAGASARDDQKGPAEPLVAAV